MENLYSSPWSDDDEKHQPSNIFQQVESHPFALAHIKFFNASCCHECKNFPLTLLCVAYQANKIKKSRRDGEEENLRARQKKKKLLFSCRKVLHDSLGDMRQSESMCRTLVEVGAMFSRKPKSFRRKREANDEEWQ